MKVPGRWPFMAQASFAHGCAVFALAAGMATVFLAPDNTRPGECAQENLAHHVQKERLQNCVLEGT